MLKADFNIDGATTEFRATQGQHMQICQNLLLNETDNKSSLLFSDMEMSCPAILGATFQLHYCIHLFFK